MRINTRIIFDIASGALIERESFEQQGSIALAKGGGGRGSSTQTANVPPELSGLYSSTGQNVTALQGQAPLSQFLDPNPTQVAPLSGTQQNAVNLTNRNLNQAQSPLSSAESVQAAYGLAPTPETGNLEDSQIAQAGQRYFSSEMRPGIENSATMQGLGRSTSLSNALAAAEGATMLPLMQGEQSRRDAQQMQRAGLVMPQYNVEQGRRDAMIGQGLQAGDVERAVTQEGYNATATDALRRQGISEQALFGPLGQLPSTIGQSTTSKTKSSGGGMFK